MKIYILFFALALLVTGFMSCDDGRIYEKTAYVPREGGVLKLTGKVSGIGKWPEGYSVVVAGFNNESEYAVISKVISTPDADNEVKIILSGISEEVKELELCVLNRLRKRVISFKTIDDADFSDTVRIDVGSIDVGMYSAIQNEVFNSTCISCHGISEPGGGLNLLEGNSYNALVNQQSIMDNSMMRVKPGNTTESMLHQILNTDISSNWRIKHGDLVTSPTKLNLIDDWIDNGAQQ